ncbi:Ankyrin repeat domain-containing protein 56 [Tupaia chinensis]|uniref:Ankyrin repeat domain-containing protein 56 n=1 Tax=Tupaia chinensis TaxID=246437 RepID=L9L5S5_TUPCH|nr:Ankyrin repeat domain-containing protein 56 [Tupaia chinensis]
MAQELSQEALLDFLCQAGGRVTNAALVGHFKSFLRDPAAPPNEHQHRRELFKGFVNSVAAVRQDPDGTKYVVLKRSGASPPALLPLPHPSEDPRGPVTPGALHYSTLQQQQRTREWVARHPQLPEARNQGPSRAWSVLPDNFLQPPSEPISEPPDSALSSRSLFPAPDGSSESCLEKPPPTVFRSIRCQLSLQSLDDFVDEESHGSEESSSGPRESPGGSEEGLQAAAGTTDWGPLRNPAGTLPASPKEGTSSQSPRGLRSRKDSHTSLQVPTGANGLADRVQEPSPWPAPKLRRSLRRSSQTGRAKLSSSDEESCDGNLLKRSRRPPRPRKPSKAGMVSSPRVDAALTSTPADVKAAVGDRAWPHNSWAPSKEGSAAFVPHRPEHKSALVPLDAREHEWIVKLASGSWFRVFTLFWEDPQLALHRDFLTGYTALHWIAKHGNLGALQNLVSGARKAGIALDVNVRSSCGYTPLHLAAMHGHQAVMKLLVQSLASRVNVRDSSGKKPWQYLTSSTSGEIWQLLGAPRGKPIFPVYPLVQSSSPTRKAKSREVSRNVTRKTSLAALFKNQHNKWKWANQYEKFPTPREKEESSD